MENLEIINASKELLKFGSPQEWISYLFDLQNSLIANNHFDGYNKSGLEMHADALGTLKNFFSTLQTNKN